MGNNINNKKKDLLCDDFVGLMQVQVGPGTCWFDAIVTALFLNDTMRQLIIVRYNQMCVFVQSLDDKNLKFRFEQVLNRIKDLLFLTEKYRYKIEDDYSDTMKRETCINIGKGISDFLKKIPQLSRNKELNYLVKLFNILKNDFDAYRWALEAEKAETSVDYLLLFVIAILNFPFHLEYLHPRQTHKDLLNKLKHIDDEEILILSTPPYSEGGYFEDLLKQHVPFRYLPKILEVGNKKYIANIISYSGCHHVISAFLCGNDAWYVYDNTRARERKHIIRVQAEEPSSLLTASFDYLNTVMNDRYCDEFGDIMNVLVFYIRDDLMIEIQKNLPLDKIRRQSVSRFTSGGRKI